MPGHLKGLSLPLAHSHCFQQVSPVKPSIKENTSLPCIDDVLKQMWDYKLLTPGIRNELVCMKSLSDYAIFPIAGYSEADMTINHHKPMNIS